eukprot:6224385-Amphidinium_carterae.1
MPIQSFFSELILSSSHCGRQFRHRREKWPSLPCTCGGLLRCRYFDICKGKISATHPKVTRFLDCKRSTILATRMCKDTAKFLEHTKFVEGFP